MNSTYMGEAPDQGDIEVGIPPVCEEGFAILSCGNTRVKIGYTALHAICSNYTPDSRSLQFRTLTDFDQALKAITCEASLGRTPRAITAGARRAETP